MSKVYMTDFKTDGKINLLEKLHRLMKESGFETIHFEKQYVAIKIHFGEPGNLSYLRPNYAKVVADYVKELGGKPFLTDANTLYVGRRNNALVHLDAAYENGYNPFTTGCHVIIADGIKGTDDVEVPVQLEYVESAKIGRAIVDSDIVISMNHFKGHELTGFGGALKNIGMGSGSRRGKMEMHNSGKPIVDEHLCRGCQACKKICNQSAIDFSSHKAHIDLKKCVGCGRCIGICPFDAIDTPNDESNDLLNRKIAEYSYAVLNGKPNFHINFIVDVSPNCDCHNENDVPFAPNIGILTSFDPVALDQACVDLVNQSLGNKKADLFHDNHPDTNGEICLEHAEKIELGSRTYELIQV